MNPPLYFDHHVNGAIARGLRRRGVDVITAEEDGTARDADENILARATALRRIVVTQDDDFLSIAVAWLKKDSEHCRIVYGHQLKVTIGQAVDDLELISKACSADEMRNTVRHLPL